MLKCICLKLFNELGGISFVSDSAYSFGCDAGFICKQLNLFLKGEVNRVGFVDTNHNYKNINSQVIGSSSVLILGDCVLDPYMLKFRLCC